ncbi:hypothetical protein BDB01DRAFT_798928 [Pilobolus umbonatus]|nr:hypothetical protein BDB01DRAFT_798928 [Pilobolus umbonatus]
MSSNKDIINTDNKETDNEYQKTVEENKVKEDNTEGGEEDTKEGEVSAKEDIEESSKEVDPSVWTAVWDDNIQAYYWWNTITNETTWDNPLGDGEETIDNKYGYMYTPEYSNPLDPILDTIDEKVKKTTDSETDPNMNAYDYYYTQEDISNPYASQAYFNARTGKFTTLEDIQRLNPENLSIENRAKKQMQYYFDVDSYTQQVNNQRYLNGGKKRALTRKEVEYFKKMKKEKKSKRAREWLLQ